MFLSTSSRIVNYNRKSTNSYPGFAPNACMHCACSSTSMWISNVACNEYALYPVGHVQFNCSILVSDRIGISGRKFAYLPHCTCIHTAQVDIQGLTDSSLVNFLFFGWQQRSTRYKGGNWLSLMVEQGTDEEHRTFYTGLAALPQTVSWNMYIINSIFFDFYTHNKNMYIMVEISLVMFQIWSRTAFLNLSLVLLLVTETPAVSLIQLSYHILQVSAVYCSNIYASVS
jgi:hypothetical protein